MTDTLVVHDETDLSTLVGENGKFRLLVEAKFRSEYGNLTWRGAREWTMEEFLLRFGSNDAVAETLLKEWIGCYGLEDGFKASLVDGGTYTLGPIMPNKPRRQRTLRYTKGIDPKDKKTLPRDHLVAKVLDLIERHELVLLNGPAGVGKSSLMNLIDHFCRTAKNNAKGGPLPVTAYTFMEKDKPPLEQLREAVSQMDQQFENQVRLLFCDDIQNVESHFWEQLFNGRFLKDHKLRIVGATTRRCASDPACPILSTDAVISFKDLRLTPEEEKVFVAGLLDDKDDLKRLDEKSMCMVVNAVTDQCGGHVFALQVSLDKLDEFARLRKNLDAGAMISFLLSKKFLDHTYTRIWPPNCDDFSDEQRTELYDAMIDDSKQLSIDLVLLLLKVYFVQDLNQQIKSKTWAEMRQQVAFKLSSRRLYSALFQNRADDGTTFKSILDIVLASLQTFKRVDLCQSCKASDGGFPKESSLQQMFFKGLTSCLPASTEVVSEMSAVLPDRGDGKKGELDFYVNSDYYYGIELMREGSSFREHKERFLEPTGPGQPNRGKYFTPSIKDFLIVDFRKPGFRPKDNDEFRLVVAFDEKFTGCQVWSKGKNISCITFGG